MTVKLENEEHPSPPKKVEMDGGMHMDHMGSTATTATAGAAVTSATDMDGHTHSAHGVDPMSMMMTMMSVFQTNIRTSLYSAAWTPKNVGVYAATCIFLVVLAALFRSIVAFKAIQEQKWLDSELARRYAEEHASADSLAKTEAGAPAITMTEAGIRRSRVRPWKLKVDPVRALIDMAIAGVGYLL